jgi:hypothetical protein
MKKILMVMALVTFVASLSAYEVIPGYTKGTTANIKQPAARAKVPYTPPSSRASVLFVEDPGDLAFGPATKPDPNWQGVLTALLGAGNFGWFGSTASTTEDGPSLDTMMNYQLVIWNTYDDWWGPPSYTAALTANDQANIQNFLVSGGQVWLIGQDMIYSGVPQSFLQSNFNMQSVTEDYISGDPSTTISGMAEINGISFDVTSDYPSNGFYSDDLAPNSNAHEVINDLTWSAYPSIASQNVTPLESSFWTIDGRSPSSATDWQDMVEGMLVAFNVTGVNEKPGTKPMGVTMAPIANPVRGKTALSYTTSVPGDVSLRVYDAAGNLVQTLVNQSEPAGRKTATWNTQALSYGVYFVRLEADGKVVSQKTVVIK